MVLLTGGGEKSRRTGTAGDGWEEAGGRRPTSPTGGGQRGRSRESRRSSTYFAEIWGGGARFERSSDAVALSRRSCGGGALLRGGQTAGTHHPHSPVPPAIQRGPS